VKHLFSALALAALSCRSFAEPLLLCGMDEVFLIDTATAEKGTIEKLWSWRARGKEGLPEAMWKAFATTDDCKPVDDAARVLISSSSGGCALVEKPSGKVLWYARVPNAHSLELLPRRRVVVASSVSKMGNKLLLFDLATPDRPLWETPFRSAHGVVWDAERQRLWALNFDELRCYKLKDWEGDAPSLEMEKSWPLPDEDGHDLQAVPDSADLTITASHHVYLFDREKNEFRLHPVLGDQAEVKCVTIHPQSGRAVYLPAIGGNQWWSSRISFLAPEGGVEFPGEKLYKARWIPASPTEVR
jgi:hypothetical protein